MIPALNNNLKFFLSATESNERLYYKNRSNMKGTKNSRESLNDRQIIAIVLKGVPATFNPFSINVTYNSKELTFSGLKREL